jgi:hypothetical protein
MPEMIRMTVYALTFGICLAACAPISAQDFSSLAADVDERDTSFYAQPTYKPNSLAIVHEKAQANAYQRRARLASMSWYGMSNSRPQASATPFTSRYSPVWETPGGERYSWYPTYRWPGYGYYVR